MNLMTIGEHIAQHQILGVRNGGYGVSVSIGASDSGTLLVLAVRLQKLC